ncbi:MAG TPA: hypothetical protein DD670_15430 [Planctomycetaceae bacterium]|nr:hypothetical protein [Planctomycetaceae bacterium]
MQTDQLEQLLREAARGDASPDVPGDLAERVRRLAGRRRRRRRVLGGAAACVLVAVVGLWASPAWNRQVAREAADDLAAEAVEPAVAPDPQLMAEMAALRERLARLSDEVAELQAQLDAEAEQRRADRRLAALRSKLATPDSHVLAQGELAKAAFLLVHRAEQYEKRNRTAEARREYDRVVQLFPETTWAKTAQTRLEQPPQNKE